MNAGDLDEEAGEGAAYYNPSPPDPRRLRTWPAVMTINGAPKTYSAFQPGPRAKSVCWAPPLPDSRPW